ncbi:MAG: PHP domain-containing protein [Rhabdochlamydiaceae bacterium]
MKADLHCHSTASDGTLTPVELITLAKEQKLSGLSITDHDTIDGYITAVSAAKEQGIRLGSGIEFSCEHRGHPIHVLGYDYLLTNQEIQDFCKRHQVRRMDRNYAILEQLAKRGFVIDEKPLFALADTKTIGRPHIAQEMVKRGYVSSIQEAFTKYLGEGKACYVSGTPFSIAETIDIIHGAQGKAFIAHPSLLPRKMGISEILKFPFDGIECFYGRFSKDAAQTWLKIAKEKKWLVSGGSDFHGSIKPETILGSSYIGQEEFDKIFEHPLT